MVASYDNLIIYIVGTPPFLENHFMTLTFGNPLFYVINVSFLNKNHNIDILQLGFLSVMRLWLLKTCYNMGIIHCNVGSMCHSSKWFLLPCLPLALPLFVIILLGCFYFSQSPARERLMQFSIVFELTVWSLLVCWLPFSCPPWCLTGMNPQSMGSY